MDTAADSAVLAQCDDLEIARLFLVDRFKRIYESVSKVQLVDRLGSEPNIVGSIHVTTSHVIFKAEESAKEIWIPNGLIGTVEKGALSALGTPLTVKCKHFLTLTFLIMRDKECQDLLETLNRCGKPVEKGALSALGTPLTVKCKHFLTLTFLIMRNKECQDLLETLNRCGKPVNITDVFAFENKERNGDIRVNKIKRGWDRFDWVVEFARQGIGVADNDAWAITEFNKDYKPLTGFSARCIEDESLMGLIAKTNPSCSTLYLIDTRSRVNAMVNKMQGKGFEDVRNYSNLRFHFFDIDNIHVMRSSLNKLLDALQILIEKDWLGFGHKFDDRCAHVGAFNDEAAREDLNLAKRTQSLWAFMDDRHDDYINPLYEPNKYGYLEKIDLHPSVFAVWIALYNRFDTGLLPRENTNDVTITTLEHIGVLEAHLASLQTKLAELKILAGKQTPGSEAMADSGHSSSISSGITASACKISDVIAPVNDGATEGKSEKQLWDELEREDTVESGIYDASFPFSVRLLFFSIFFKR
ncbi:unnamed protein product [Gongylonema pulchrum]|uniref:Myotubularin phosphatase domain-containing protein n=1 Tax=Gongylonema pulchrum TaxID=637853 RepID=A0A183DUR0_9BILA|nr:unnamed protein product [Gongylonema pulchrum]